MDHIEGRFNGVRDTDIYYQAWLPDGEAKAVILVVHGLGEHSGRYTNVVDHFVPLGYAIYGHDLVGHGKSGGRREYVERFEDFTDTLAIYDHMVRDWQPDKPIFLLGHSVGGLIAADYLLDHQADFQGAIFSAPSVKAGESISAATIALAKILALLVPKAGLEALDATGVSRDPDVVRAYVEDPLVFHGKTPARTAAELLKAIERVTAEAHKITLPFVIVQGSADRLVNPAGAQMLYDEAASADKTIYAYEGLYHEVHNEPERARVLHDVETWLEAHC
jgi:acylglycerol lipase